MEIHGASIINNRNASAYRVPLQFTDTGLYAINSIYNNMVVQNCLRTVSIAVAMAAARGFMAFLLATERYNKNNIIMSDTHKAAVCNTMTRNARTHRVGIPPVLPSLYLYNIINVASAIRVIILIIFYIHAHMTLYTRVCVIIYIYIYIYNTRVYSLPVSI